MDETVKVLLIEDEEDATVLFRNAIQKSKYPTKLKTLTKADDALDFLSQPQNCRLVDVIFLDLHLPGMSGLELLENISEMKDACQIPIVIVTTISDHIRIKKAYSLGVKAYVEKPINTEKYLNMLVQIGIKKD